MCYICVLYDDVQVICVLIDVHNGIPYIGSHAIVSIVQQQLYSHWHSKYLVVSQSLVQNVWDISIWCWRSSRKLLLFSLCWGLYNKYFLWYQQRNGEQQWHLQHGRWIHNKSRWIWLVRYASMEANNTIYFSNSPFNWGTTRRCSLHLGGSSYFWVVWVRDIPTDVPRSLSLIDSHQADSQHWPSRCC